MRIAFIFLSVIVLLTLIQFSNGAPRRVRALHSGELRNTMKKFGYKLQPYINDDSIDESDESNEEEKKKVVDTNEYIEKSSEESSNENNKEKEEEEDRDNEVMLSHFINDNYGKISQNSDEK